LGFRDEFIPFSHYFASLLAYNKLTQSDTDAMSHVPTNFAFKAERLLLGGFGKLPLKRVLLSTVTLLLSFMVTFTLG
jgi:hypothetical protein